MPAVRIAGSPEADWPDSDAGLDAVLHLARAAAPSPVRIDAGTVAAVREAGLPPPDIVELVCWLSVLQMLHRLTCFYGPERAA